MSRRKLYEFRGKPATIYDIMAATGLPRSTARKRISGNRFLEGEELADPHREPRTDAVLFTIKGETKCLSEWARLYGISRNGVEYRLEMGWPIEAALAVPSRRQIARNRRIIHRIATAFRTSTGGYVRTFTDPLGTGVGRHAHHLQSEKPA